MVAPLWFTMAPGRGCARDDGFRRALAALRAGGRAHAHRGRGPTPTSNEVLADLRASSGLGPDEIITFARSPHGDIEALSGLTRVPVVLGPGAPGAGRSDLRAPRRGQRPPPPSGAGHPPQPRLHAEAGSAVVDDALGRAGRGHPPRRPPARALDRVAGMADDLVRAHGHPAPVPANRAAGRRDRRGASPRPGPRWHRRARAAGGTGLRPCCARSRSARRPRRSAGPRRAPCGGRRPRRPRAGSCRSRSRRGRAGPAGRGR